MSRRLTVKQHKFADNYIKVGNATQAAILAGYSKRTARSIGQENLTKPDIKKYIAKRMRQIETEKIMDAKEAMELLSRIARGQETETVFVPLVDGSLEEEEKAADLKTRITAVKEIIKRYPNDDQLLKVRLRELKAKAKIAEHQADMLTNSDNDNLVVKFIRTDRRNNRGNHHKPG